MKFTVALSLLLIIVACQPEDDGSMRQQVLEVDRNFSKMATEKGVAEAFIYFADERVIKPEAGRQPIIGKYALMQSFKNSPPHYSLSWEPLRAEASGELAYTFGGYTLKTTTRAGQDTTLYGNYVSIWKRKKDGSWRYVFDGGNPTPGPVVLK